MGGLVRGIKGKEKVKKKMDSVLKQPTSCARAIIPIVTTSQSVASAWVKR